VDQSRPSAFGLVLGLKNFFTRPRSSLVQSLGHESRLRIDYFFLKKNKTHLLIYFFGFIASGVCITFHHYKIIGSFILYAKFIRKSIWSIKIGPDSILIFTVRPAFIRFGLQSALFHQPVFDPTRSSPGLDQ